MIIVYFILVFLYIFGPVFNTLGSWADGIFFLSSILLFVHIIVRKRLLPHYIVIFLLLIPVYIYTFSIALFQSFITTGDLIQIILKPIRILVTLIAGYAIVKSIEKKYPEKYTSIILNFIYCSILSHAVIMIVQFHNPVFREFIYGYTFGGEVRSTFDYDFRMGGLSGSTGGAVLSVVQSIGVVLVPFLLKRTSNRYIKGIYIFSAIFIVYSILICGRSGIWSMIIFTLLATLILDSRSRRFKFLKLIKILLFLFIGIFILIIAIENLANNDPIFFALNRTLDTFINFKESGNFEDGTVNTLKGHLLFPTDLVTLIFGDTEVNVNTQFDRKLDSDIGYIRNIWGFGIFGFGVYLLPILKWFRIAWKYYYFSEVAKLLLILTIITLFFHAKEIFLYTRMLFSIYSIVLALFYIEINRLKAEFLTA